MDMVVVTGEGKCVNIYYIRVNFWRSNMKRFILTIPLTAFLSCSRSNINQDETQEK